MQSTFRNDEDVIEEKFRELGKRAEGVLVAYLMGGDPDPKAFLANSVALIEGGADILEIGIPFSDPVADGPVIQAAGARALSGGATPRNILEAIGKLSSQLPVPLVVISYYNPLLAMGLERFVRKAAENGVNGVVIPDLALEESDNFRSIALKHKIDTIYLAAPNTSQTRLQSIIEKSKGFLYLVSLYGVTGPRDALSPQALELVKTVKLLARGRVPISAGFGVTRPQHVSSLLNAGADGAIVGSALVRTVAEHLDDPEQAASQLKKLVMALKEASRQLRPRKLDFELSTIND